MTLNPPRKVRVAIYVFSTLGSLVVGYLTIKGLIGVAEAGLWTTLSAAVTTMAGLNATK